MSISHSTFEQRRPLSSSLTNSELGDQPADLITFLAVAQKLNIAILSLTWQAQESIGKGGTSRIDQALVNVQTSFAFKRFSDQRVNDSVVFDCLLREILVLGHPSVHDHPHIVELQGICWDVLSTKGSNAGLKSPSYVKVWPALVFEKSQFGDLLHFAQVPIGKELRFNDRLRLCKEIGAAIADMHLHNIIHGDIKPENVLIFKKTDEFTAKVKLPRSRPWDAPEYVQQGLYKATPDQAHKMDVFSFGMLCLWFLFENNLSGHRKDQLKYLEKVKNEKKLIPVAYQLLEEEALQPEKRENLKRFFSTSLICNPDSREANLELSLEWLGLNRQSEDLKLLNWTCLPSECEFEIGHNIHSLYFSDYRVRSCITTGLEERIEKVPESPLAFQLALCYKLGFGCVGNNDKAEKMLQQSGRPKQHLDEALIRISDFYIGSRHGSIYENLFDSGYILNIAFYEYYLKQGCLEEAVSFLKRDIKNLKLLFGNESSLIFLLKIQLAAIIKNQGWWQEAEKLHVQVMETSSRVLGAEHPDTLTSMANLASTYRNQGRWQEAEKLEVQVMETSSRVLGVEHLSTLTSMANLASTYWKQGRWQEAEKLDVQVMETSSRVLGAEHPDTLTYMHNLAYTWHSRGRNTEALQLMQDCVSAMTKVLGLEHPHTKGSY